uniref:2'-5'-oligoadenylate synthase 1-like isoform X1 n=1 Tax=Camelus bactrianus TaxID=9837 RepID=A0A9W3HE13_CAMBA|nr:2'-5'-oligoadenylate synthase 1-like isoform X1 [Camelus bactrianus]
MTFSPWIYSRMGVPGVHNCRGSFLIPRCQLRQCGPGASSCHNSSQIRSSLMVAGSTCLLADLKLHLYRKLHLCNDSDEAQLCALALLPYQVDFVKASVSRVKELIRLMMHWFKTSFASTTEENKFRRLPSSYTVELLTIYIWERAEKPLFFSLVQGMRAVLKLLVRYAEIDVVWHRHYHRKFPIFVKVYQKHTRPFILDPVNPTINVCDTCNAWDEVAHVARRSLLKPLFSRVRAEPPWLFTNDW